MGAASRGRASAGTEGRRMARIMLESITKQFGSDVIAVDDVSLSTEDGEFMVLVGPSGCGKSTILRIVAGLEEVTAGEEPRHRHGVPELRVVPAHDGGAEPRLRTEAPRCAEGRDQAEGDGGRQDARHHAAYGSKACRPVGRPASAGGDGQGHGPGAEGLPHGRTAVEPRCQAPGADARRTGQAS